MATGPGKRRVSPGWLAVVGVFLVALGAVGGFGGLPFGALALPLGMLFLIAALALSLRRSPEIAERPAQDRAERRRSFAFRLLLLGLAMAPVSLAISVATGNVSTAGVFVFPAVIAVALAVAVGLSGRLFLLAMIFGAMLLFFAFATFELELRHPDSFENFVPALWVTLGCAIAFGAATAAFLQRRHRTLRPATSLLRRLVSLGLALLVAGSAVSWFVSGASRVTAAKAKGATVVVMEDNDFRPNEFAVRQGDAARFYLVNHDGEPHTFTIDEIVLDEYIGPRGERLITFEVPQTADAELELICVVSGHEDMEGTIRVEPA